MSGRSVALGNLYNLLILLSYSGCRGGWWWSRAAVRKAPMTGTDCGTGVTTFRCGDDGTVAVAGTGAGGGSFSAGAGADADADADADAIVGAWLMRCATATA